VTSESTASATREPVSVTREPVLAWDEPSGLAPRGTVVVLPGRGERPGVYERFGRRLAADAYRVRVVDTHTEGRPASSDSTRSGSTSVEEVALRVKAVLTAPASPAPTVLVGSDLGALLALRLVGQGAVRLDGLVLAGLPDPGQRVNVSAEEEPELRASCPTHQSLLRDTDRGLFEAGGLGEDSIPAELRELGGLAEVSVPVLALHGDNDAITPLAGAAATYRRLPNAQLVSVRDGRHDVLNAANHRAVAATVVLWLERLRAGADPVQLVPAGGDPR
jgi:alpha-beta hydrolase superfamily lysophospholipase